MIVCIAKHIRSVRQERVSLEGQLNHMLPSRLTLSCHDKDMSDNRASRKTNQDFQVGVKR
jgi:hypothetical protein